MTPFIDFYYSGSRSNALVALFRLYPEYSISRLALMWLNAANLIGPRLAPGTFDVSELNGKLPEQPTNNGRAYLSHKILQNGRIYVFNFEESKKRISHVFKIAMTSEAAIGIQREYEILQTMANHAPFTIPHVSAFSAWNGGCMLGLDPIPEGSSNAKNKNSLPDDLYEAIAALRPKTLPDYLPALKIHGWESAGRFATTPVIIEICNIIDPKQLIKVSSAHRDLGSENLFYCRSGLTASDYTLIDWEYYTDTAPALSDRVSVWLGCRHRLFKGWRSTDVNELAHQFLDDFSDATGGKIAATVALLHLADLGIDLARMLTGDSRIAT